MFSLGNTPKKDDKKEAVTMGQRMLGFCFAVFLSVILLYVALELLAQIWGWLLIICAIIVGLWGVLVFYRRWRDRW